MVNYTGTGVNRKAKIKVKYDDYLVDRDVRWCGDIILPMGVPLELKETKSITLDKSGTPNRHTQTTAGDFINPTVLTFEEGATFVLRTNSNMYVRGGSTLHLKPNSKLTIAGGAKLYIRPNSFLQIDDCAELEVLPGGKVIVETAGVLQISHQAILNVHDGQAAFNLNNAAIIPQGFVNPSADVPPAYRINDGVHEWNGAAQNVRNLVGTRSQGYLSLVVLSQGFRYCGETQGTAQCQRGYADQFHRLRIHRSVERNTGGGVT